MADRIMDATECFLELANEQAQETDDKQPRWLLDWVLGQELRFQSRRCLFDPSLIDFQQRCSGKLVRYGDSASDAQHHVEAIIQYSTALLLDPVVPQAVLAKRSKVYATMGSWENALSDANQVRHYYLT